MHSWMRNPQPMNDEWLGEEIADIKLMLEHLERRPQETTATRQAYLEYLRRLEVERDQRRSRATE